MKKFIFLTVLILSFIGSTGQNLIQNASFEDTSCDICATLNEFYEGCETNWQNYKYAPAAFDSSLPNCTFFNGVYYYAPHGDKHAMVAVNSGIFQEGDFQPGTYSISFNYTRGEGIFENYPVYVNVGFANGLVNVDWDETTNDNVPIENVASQLVTINDPVNWGSYSGTFTLTSDFENVVIYGSSTMQFDGSGGQNRAPTMRGLVDNFVLECLDCECIPDPIVITVDGEDITETLAYTIPCDQDCININATNVSNAVYNTTDLVLTDLNGLFCLPPGSDLQSYTAYIEGQDSCGNDYYQEILITIEQDCCIDEPYIEPFWEQCDSNNVCELENWPIHVLDDDGSPLLIIDGYSFVWSDGSTSDTLYGAVAMQEYWVEVTYPDGCVYTITYYEGCCDDDIEVIFDECPKAEMLPMLERELQNYEEGRSVVTRPDLERAIEAYQEMGRADGDDCDPCVGGIVNITIVDLDGNPITNYDSITITNNDTGVTVPVGIPNFGVYVNTPYTVTVVVTDDDGHECTYTYDFEYVCEEEPCSDLMSPSNVQLNGSTLTWDPVPGAIGYVVESTNFWPMGCNCDYPVSISPIETNETSVQLPVGERRCFVIQVRAICADGTSSLPSDWICVGGNGGHGKVIDNVSITPNPTNGHMTFNVETNVDSKVNIEVYDIYGTMLKSFVVEVSQERQSSIYWNGSNLNTGIYFVKFKTNEETIHQRVIVH